MTLDITQLLERHWKTVAVSAVITMALAAALSFVRPLEYSSTMRLLIIQQSGVNLDPYTAIRSAETIATNLSQVIYTSVFYDNVTAGLALLAYTLPTLVMPPIAERLSLRYQSGVVIPAGLCAIGLGFIVMKLGMDASKPDWLTMLPGCLLAGIGLGITNTPVTNTTTGSVSRDRAGMASGIDMSARMVSLAVNIALMGVILTSSVLSHLKQSLPTLSVTELHLLAERVAAGSDVLIQGLSRDAAYDALRNGFGWLMIYGAVGVWIMAAISAFIFNYRVFGNIESQTNK